MESNEWSGGTSEVYGNRRINAITAKSFVSGDPEILQEEMLVEIALNAIFGVISNKLEHHLENSDEDMPEEDMYVNIELDSKYPLHLKNEIIARLEGYGYQVQYVAGDEEDLEYVKSMHDLARDGDEIIQSMLKELEDSTFLFTIRFDNPYGGYEEDDV